jgi:hypothetical protein
VRHGTTNLFAALNVGTGEVVGECKPSRDGRDFLTFLKKAAKPYAGKQIHVVLDNLSTHGTPEVTAWLKRNPHVRFHLTPVGSSWINQIETWFSIITRQSIRRGTFSSVGTLITQIRRYIDHWNATANRSSGPPPPTRSWPRSNSSRPTSRSSSTTTPSKRTESRSTSREIYEVWPSRMRPTRSRPKANDPTTASVATVTALITAGHGSDRSAISKPISTGACRR